MNASPGQAAGGESLASGTPEAVQVAIIGMGLIGGSVGLGLRLVRGRSGFRVTGYDQNPLRSRQAVEMGAADRAADSLADAVRDADLVVAAVPAEAVAPVLQEAGRWAPRAAVLTDVASIKRAVVEQLGSRLPSGQWYVGGHPMAGSERSGLAAADPYLFQNAVYVVTPLPEVPEDAVARVEAMARALGAHVVRLSPAEHDEAAAAASHLPHLLATCLVLAADRLGAEGVPVWELAATGFRDATRLALGSEDIWASILSLNRPAVEKALAAFLEVLDRFRRAMDLAPGAPDLKELLAAARRRRSGIRLQLKGYGFPLWDVVVRVEDRPGAIHEVTGVLARAGVNIADIEILRAREGEAGTLRLGFDSQERMQHALALLRQAGWSAWER